MRSIAGLQGVIPLPTKNMLQCLRCFLRSLPLLCRRTCPSESHPILVYQRATKIRSKESSGQRQHSADQYILIARCGTRCRSSTPPIVYSTEDCDVVYESVKHANFCLLRRESITLDERHELICTGGYGWDGEEDREDSRVEGKHWKHGRRDSNV